MFGNTTRRWRAGGSAAVVLVGLSLAATACSSSSGATGVPSSNSSSSASTSDLYSNAVVASAADILPNSTMAAIKKRGKLIVGEALDAPLLSQQDPTTKDVTGFDADLAKLLAIYILGKPNVEIIPPATQTREAMLENGTVDVVFNTYTITTQRAAEVDFAGPYFDDGLAVAVKSSNTTITGIGSLGGKTVIVGADTPAVTEVPKQQPTSKLITFGTDPEAIQALVEGRGDAYVQDETLLASDAATNSQIKVVGSTFTSEAYGIGLKHGDTAFKQFINNWLLKIEQNGTWGRVWKATLGTVTHSSVPTPPKIGSVPGT
ncbi:MAG TPA: glutamate ABC transporter substrate-binding protein [Trebonia sp.]|nr:glutamate ABC transporter substrate-binding protein [Trebonia sp.]